MDKRELFCLSCEAQIFWAVTARGRDIPLNATADPTGNVSFVEGIATVLNQAQAVAARNEGAILFMPHFATCPARERFRRRKAKLVSHLDAKPPAKEKARPRRKAETNTTQGELFELLG